MQLGIIMNRDDVGLLLLIALVGVLAMGIVVSIYFISMGAPKSPEETFKKDPSIIEYCYLVVVGTKDLPVSNGRETRLEITKIMQKVCVDRNLSIISSVPFDNSHNEAFMYWQKKIEETK
jgi:hypothetical protein